MLAKTKELLVVKSSLKEYPAIKFIALSLEKRIRMGDKELEQKLINSGKSVGDCWKYVLERARMEKCSGASDSVVMSWVIHYYDENGNPSDMKVRNLQPNEVSGNLAYHNAKEDKIRRMREKRDLIDLTMGETGYKKDKIVTKLVTFYLEVRNECEQNKIKSPTQNDLFEWVKKSVYLRDCCTAIDALGIPDDIANRHIDILKDIKILEKDRKELIVNDMPTLF